MFSVMIDPLFVVGLRQYRTFNDSSLHRNPAAVEQLPTVNSKHPAVARVRQPYCRHSKASIRLTVAKKIDFPE